MLIEKLMRRVRRSADVETVKNYLVRFGYAAASELADEAIDFAIGRANKILGVDGQSITDQTVKGMLTIPRCGCTDAQFARTELNQWLLSKAQAGITYNILGYVNGLSRDSQEEQIANAFAYWEQVSSFRAIRSSDRNADILINVSSSRQEEFGTAGNVLAWAYLPQGKNWTKQLLMKFDLAENWNSISLEVVACHEIGHLLGLDHTDINGELMFPTYNQRVTKPQKRYDIPQCQLRYPWTAAGQPPVVVDTASDPLLAAIVTHGNRTYRLVRSN
jgi:hypothetical protein